MEDKIFAKYKIRNIDINDYYKGYLELLSELTTTPSIDFKKWEERITIIKNNNYHNIFVIENDGKIIASITLIIELKIIRNLANVGHIEDVVVSRQYRGLGIGDILINYCKKYSKDKNCYKVILNCNKNLIKFYQKFGFQNKNQEMSLYLSKNTQSFL